MYPRKLAFRYTSYVVLLLVGLWILDELSILTLRRQSKDPENFVRTTSIGSLSNFLKSGTHETLCLCHQHWVGIKVATYSQGCTVLEIQEFNAENDLRLLQEILAQTEVKHLIINGIPPGSLSLPEHVQRISPRTKTSFVYHGTPAQHAGYPEEGMMLGNIIDQVINGTVSKLGFVRRGLAQTFKDLQIPNVYSIDNIVYVQPPPPPENNVHSIVKIGAFFWFSKTRT